MSASNKVDEIVFKGESVSILDGGYEKTRAIRMLNDYLTHGDKGETIEQRAEEAIEALEEEGYER